MDCQLKYFYIHTVARVPFIREHLYAVPAFSNADEQWEKLRWFGILSRKR